MSFQVSKYANIVHYQSNIHHQILLADTQTENFHNLMPLIKLKQYFSERFKMIDLITTQLYS